MRPLLAAYPGRMPPSPDSVSTSFAHVPPLPTMRQAMPYRGFLRARARAHACWPGRPANPWTGVRILGYHAVNDDASDVLAIPPARLGQHLDVVRSAGIEIIRMHEVYDRLEQRPDERAVAIVFDDGYLDMLTAALPILSARGVPATVFVSDKIVSGEAPCTWYHRPPPFMNWDECHQLAASGLFDVQPHGSRHLDLSQLDDDAVREELVGSVERLAAEGFPDPHLLLRRRIPRAARAADRGCVPRSPGCRVDGARRERRGCRPDLVAPDHGRRQRAPGGVQGDPRGCVRHAVPASHGRARPCGACGPSVAERPRLPINGAVGDQLRGSVLMLASQLVTAAGAFVMTVVIARSLGPSGRGEYAFAITAAVFISIFSHGGLSSALAFYGARHPWARRRLVALYVGTSAVTTLPLTIIIWLLVGAITRSAQPSFDERAGILVLAAVALASSLFDGTVGLLLAARRYRGRAVVSVISTVLPAAYAIIAAARPATSRSAAPSSPRPGPGSWSASSASGRRSGSRCRRSADEAPLTSRTMLRLQRPVVLRRPVGRARRPAPTSGSSASWPAPHHSGSTRSR